MLPVPALWAEHRFSTKEQGCYSQECHHHLATAQAPQRMVVRAAKSPRAGKEEGPARNNAQQQYKYRTPAVWDTPSHWADMVGYVQFFNQSKCGHLTNQTIYACVNTWTFTALIDIPQYSNIGLWMEACFCTGLPTPIFICMYIYII